MVNWDFSITTSFPWPRNLKLVVFFGVSSHEYLSYALANRREWESKGEQLVKDYLSRFSNATEEAKAPKVAKAAAQPKVTAPSAMLDGSKRYDSELDC